MVKSINKCVVSGALSDTRLKKSFDQWWPELEKLLENFEKNADTVKTQSTVPARSQDDILEEVLGLVRRISRQVRKLDKRNYLSGLRKNISRSRDVESEKAKTASDENSGGDWRVDDFAIRASEIFNLDENDDDIDFDDEPDEIIK